MTKKRVLDPNGCLFGLPVVPPEWQSRRSDARRQELEKTRTLRAARLAVQAGTGKSAANAAADKSSVRPNHRRNGVAGVRVAVETAALSPGRFTAGQTVIIAARRCEAARSGTFVIIRALPTENGTLLYRVRSDADGHERIVSEAELH